MITGVIKNKVDKIWTDIWAGGITNPLTVIEQLTYLMFIRSLDEKELETEEFEHMTGEKMEKIFPQSAVGQSMRWSKFKNNDPRDIFNVISQRVFPAIKNMKHGRLPDFTEQGELVEIADDSSSDVQNETAFARYMSDAMFLIPTPQVLQKIITGLDDLYEHDIADLDMQGDLYEYMLGKLATAGQNGQFRTPKHMPVVNIYGEKDGIEYDLLGMPITPELFLAFVDTVQRIPRIIIIDDNSVKRMNSKQINKDLLISNRIDLLSYIDFSIDAEKEDDEQVYQLLHTDKETALKQYEDMMSSKEIKYWG